MANKSNKSESVAELAIKYKISGRAKNVLERFGIYSLKKFEDFLKRQNNISSLNNVGKKTEIELLKFSSQVLPNLDLSKMIVPKKQYKIRDKYKVEADKKLVNGIKLNDPDYFIKMYIYYNLQFLNPRISKAINEKLNELNILSFLEFFSYYDIKSIRGVGIGKSIEFQLFIDHIKEIVSKTLQYPNFLRSLNFLPEVINYNSNNKDFSLNDLDNYLNYDKTQVHFFKLLNYLFKTNFFGDEKENVIFKSRVRVLNTVEKRSMLEISKNFNLTGERIRQLNLEIEEKFWTKIELLVFVIGINRVTSTYYLEENDGIYDVNIKKINKIEETDFTEDFIYRSIYYLINDRYYTLYLKYKNQEKKYFINNIYKDIKFNDIVNDIENLKNREEISKLTINIKDFLLKYASDKYANDNNLLNIFKQVIEGAAESKCDENDNVEILRNYRYMHEYALEVLKDEGSPLTLDQIFKKIELKYPGLVKNVDALRGNIQTSDKFIYFGRSSTYGLKEWEDQGRVKGGTIKQIVREFLETKKSPVHISEITQYVLQFRSTNEFNIMGNLKFDRHDTFVFFNSGFVGLTSKEYHPRELKYNKINLNLFRRSYARMFNNDISKLKYDEFVEELAKKNKLTTVQIVSIVNKRIEKGKLIINEDGFLIKIESK